MSSTLAEKIVSSIEPFVGKFIAEAALKTQSAVIGKTVESINQEDLDRLAERIGEAMRIFGKDGSAIAQSIKSIR